MLLLGTYDSRSREVVERHARWIAESGVGVYTPLVSSLEHTGLLHLSREVRGDGRARMPDVPLILHDRHAVHERLAQRIP